jgi:hypothetical protein
MNGPLQELKYTNDRSLARKPTRIGIVVDMELEIETITALASLEYASKKIIEGEFPAAQALLVAIGGKRIHVVHVALGRAVFPWIVSGNLFLFLWLPLSARDRALMPSRATTPSPAAATWAARSRRALPHGECY